jgi:hypothetical protein
MKYYQFPHVAALNHALSRFDRMRVKVLQIQPFYFEVAPPLTNRGAFNGQVCFCVTTDEAYVPTTKEELDYEEELKQLEEAKKTK